MHRLYAFQQRLALTSSESSALLSVVVLLLVGCCVRYAEGQAAVPVGGSYAALDSTFTARSTPPASEVLPDSARTDAALASAEAAAEEPRTPRRPAKAGPVRMNVNTASGTLLQRLPGIGPKMAERIIEYRTAHGDFARPRDVIRVKGIGPKTFEKLAPYLFVETDFAEADQVAAAGGADGR